MMEFFARPLQMKDVWSKIMWTSFVEKIFLQILIEETGRQNVSPNILTDKAWESVYQIFISDPRVSDELWEFMYRIFISDPQATFDKAQLKEHMAVLQDRYATLLKPVYDAGGYVWDNQRKVVVVDESKWAEIVKGSPEIAQYKRCGCYLFKELHTLFTKRMATSKYVISSTQGVNDWHLIGNSNSLHNHEKLQLEPQFSSGSNKRKSEQTVTLGPRKRVQGEKRDLASNAMAPKADPHSATVCLTVIGQMQGVDRRLHNAAIALFQNPTWRKTFITLKNEKRLNWLKAMLPSV